MRTKFTIYDFTGKPREQYVAVPVDLPTSRARLTPAHRIILVDRSGSMWGDLESLKAMLEKLLVVDEFRLREGAIRVTLISYSGYGVVRTHFARVLAADVMAPASPYLRELRGLQPTGLTCISGALVAAESHIHDDEATAITLHSDGYANDPGVVEERRAIAAATARLAARRHAFVDCVAYRDSADFALLSSIANACSGACVQARDVQQVYDALLRGTRAVVTPDDVVDLDLAGAAVALFVSRAARRVLGTDDLSGLTVRGLPTGADRMAWRLRRLTARDYERESAPVADSADGDLRPVLALARWSLARGDLMRAKYAMVATRLRGMLDRHARALTAPQVAAFAAELDAALFGEDPVLADRDGGRLVAAEMTAQQNYVNKAGVLVPEYRLSGAVGPGVVNVAQAIAHHPKGLLVDVALLAERYRRRGIKRVPGLRQADGTIAPPSVDVVPHAASRFTEVLSATLNNGDATINLTTSEPVDLVDAATRAVIPEVAGVRLADLRSFRSWTIVGDGELNVPSLTVRVVDKDLHAELVGLGIVRGDFDHNVARTIDLSALPVVQYSASFASVDAGTVTRLYRLTILDRLFRAMLSGAAGAAHKYSPQQVAELQSRCITPALNWSPPTTTEYADKGAALRDGVLDTRVSYKVKIGTCQVLAPEDLYSGDEYLARRYVVSVGGEVVSKPTLAATVLQGAVVGPRALSARVKLNSVDAVTLPVYDAVLRAMGHAVGEPDADDLRTLLRRDVGLPAAEARRLSTVIGMGSSADRDKAAALRAIADRISDAVEVAWTHLRPLVFYVGASGVVPDELKAQAIDADALGRMYPSLGLTKAQREATFFVCDEGAIISVYAEPAYYSTGRSAVAST